MAVTFLFVCFSMVWKIGISQGVCYSSQGTNQGKRLEGYNYATMSLTGKLLCQKQCSLQKKCRSINFNQNKQFCELNTEATTSLTEDSKWEYIAKSDFMELNNGACKTHACTERTMCISLTRGVAKCIAIECDIPPSIQNGATSTVNTAIGENTHYSCNLHYTMVGIGSITCKANQAYTPINFYCKPTPCNHPPSLNNAYILSKSLEVGGTARYACNSAFQLQGSGNQITCILGSTWTSFTFSCDAIPCSSPPGVANGYLVSQQLFVGGISKYACNYGYTLQGNSQITCQLGPVWTSILFQCQPVVCPGPPSLSHGYLASQSGSTYGSTAKYACNALYFISNGDTIHCQADGSWSHMGFSCKLLGIG